MTDSHHCVKNPSSSSQSAPLPRYLPQSKRSRVTEERQKQQRWLERNSHSNSLCSHSSSSYVQSIWIRSCLFLSILCLCLSTVNSSALTTPVAAGERLCFHALADKPKEKIGFYFAVQSGGEFDIDWTVIDPKDTIIIEGEKERQGDYVFTASIPGEYTFCFNNDMSSFSEKMIDFDIIVENEPRATTPVKTSSLMDHTSSLEDSIYKLSGSLSSIERTQKYFRTRENRNSATVKDTQNRIFYFNIGCSLLLIGMSFTQVFIVRKFFNSPGKYVRV